MKKKQKSNKPLGHFIKNSADRLAEAEKIVTMSPGDLYMFQYMRTESRILLFLAVRFWVKVRVTALRKLLSKLIKYSKHSKLINASNEGGVHVGNSENKH
ncbi:MAG: hypothetical protein PHQ43_12610 [Dehalococcoidales bacterium]|nr:hypothetical protein [Dehalococcoidales bacterium]